MVTWSKQAVKTLYKTLLNHGYKNLKYTDKDFYQRLIKEEFTKYKHVTDQAEKQFHLDKGHAFLKQEQGKLL